MHVPAAGVPDPPVPVLVAARAPPAAVAGGGRRTILWMGTARPSGARRSCIRAAAEAAGRPTPHIGRLPVMHDDVDGAARRARFAGYGMLPNFWRLLDSARPTDRRWPSSAART